MLSATDLLAFLAQRGGQEYRTAATTQSGRGKRAVTREVGEYRFTMRGESVQATGPSGQTRQLSRAEFGEIFGSYLFREPLPTGEMTDLGPLFG
ncbi:MULTISPECIES: hypothetical protein [Deinococcus]|jgi:hypothetical protein|uniref:Uncharacterized protein n=1 Tax=Deinococcus radiodurans (strain ATCC 13939 / DSM 20539 / JCM 16871 / CCUG 27074 / LMG 4051 / NBRC 15346 / NCIMB 9279 / VKM B-1422 / R1) TaxID=243230 RepID=Q9RUG5_DEIRA|nr:hypothetical protein [Deinococcus radiodurans]AAF11000.1 hypothetical protein DR_1421 [Deinococcus radiodurans R1 = ATCC 13939 = DSM 20539]ANC71436.1 hypothetical protein A2G07_06450 [Deinococcus radiodurans R1 = ATCC 13939 = DSM 20539]QEM70875.1 hypothetical protein DXG80_03255 [Deinococcus radiodurans]QIP29442.1 hypothetical protein HAV23_10005 [Deinococcus radiodurans]QIP31867.1 hypothetical protein HAV35_06795 [Deinococcus radiodurans]